MAALPSESPPSYSTLNLASQEVAVASNIENVTGPLIGKSFEDKNARVMFTQKVLCIFILQSIVVCVVLRIFIYYRIIIKQDFIGIAAVIYLITILVMACINQVKSRNIIYKYIMLVYYPISATFIVIMVPTLFDKHFQLRLREAFFSAWVFYILAGIAVLFFCIFSLDCKREFVLTEKCLVTVVMFVISYFGVYLPLYLDNKNLDPLSTLCITLVLYGYLMFILYDIEVMTSGHYRSPLTPADYVTGVVNMQIGFLFIITDFIRRKCCCGNVQ